MNLWSDVRIAARLLVKDRGFTLAAVLALTLGIAVNNTVFTIVNAALLRDLPFDMPDRIVTVGTRNTGNARNPNSGISYLDLQDWRAATRTFDGLSATTQETMNIADENRPAERFVGSYISANAFSLIGRRPSLGRDFRADDDRPGADPVVIIGYSVWRNRYGSAPDVIGRVIRVNGVASTVIGVMPDGFGFPQVSAIWQPLALLPPDTMARRAVRTLRGFGRLARGVTIDQASADLDRVAASLTQQHADTNKNVGGRIAPYRNLSIGPQLYVVLSTLMGAVAFVLLIACANVANLLLARAATRSREVSVRISIGASRWRIVRQLLVESLLLAAVAGVLGFALSVLGIRLFWNAVKESGPPYWLQFTLDGRVFAFFATVSLGTSVLFGLLPALHTSKTNIVGVLNDAGRGSAGSIRGRGWAGTLVTGQLALTLVLLTGAGLMMRNFIAQYQLDAGIETAGIVRMRLDLTERKYPAMEERGAFYRRLEERLASLPALRATIASTSPRGGGAPREVSVEGRPVVEASARPVVTNLAIGLRYFESIGTRPVRGRTFTEADGRPGQITAIVNERFARMHFPNEDALGRRIRLEATPTANATDWLTIVGVAPNVRQRATEDLAFDPIVYVPYAANPLPFANILARSDSDLAVVAGLLREQLRTLDADLPVFDVMTLDDALAFDRFAGRVFGSMFAIFAVIALVLATVGLYAVTAYSVGQRTREIGVRVALGAQGRHVWWLVTRRVSVQLAIGLFVGMAGAFGVGQLLKSIIVGTSPTDSLTLISVATLLVLVALGASLIPARRAMRLDPVVALRAE